MPRDCCLAGIAQNLVAAEIQEPSREFATVDELEPSAAASAGTLVRAARQRTTAAVTETDCIRAR